MNATTSADEPMFEPSVMACIGLSAFGGFLEVSSTMCLAYPEYRTKLGHVYSPFFQKAMMVQALVGCEVARKAIVTR